MNIYVPYRHVHVKYSIYIYFLKKCCVQNIQRSLKTFLSQNSKKKNIHDSRQLLIVKGIFTYMHVIYVYDCLHYTLQKYT